MSDLDDLEARINTPPRPSWEPGPEDEFIEVMMDGERRRISIPWLRVQDNDGARAILAIFDPPKEERE